MADSGVWAGVDLGLPPLAADSADRSFEALARQLYGSSRVARAIEARKFRQNEERRFGSALQQSPLQSGQAPAGQAADAQAEQAGAPSVSRRQQRSEAGSASAWERQRQQNRQDSINADNPRGALATDPFFDPQAFNEFMRRDRTDQFMALPPRIHEAWDEHAPDILPSASDVVQSAPTAAAIAGAANILVGTGGEAPTAPMPAPGELPPRRAAEPSSESVDGESPTMPKGSFPFVPLPPRRDGTQAMEGGAARQPLPSNASGSIPAIDSIPQLLPRQRHTPGDGSQPRGDVAASRPGGGAIPLPPRRRPDPAAATDGDQQAFRPPEETQQEDGANRREALNDMFGALMRAGAEMARAGSQPGASFGGALAQGIGEGGASFDASQRQRQEDQRRARLESEEKQYRADQLQLARERLEQQGVNQGEARRIARARLEIDQARAAADPILSYENINGSIVGLTRSGKQIRTGLKAGRSLKDLETVIAIAKELSMRSETNPLTGKSEEVFDRALLGNSLRLLGEEALAQRFEQQRSAQPLQIGQRVRAPNRDVMVNGQTLKANHDYQWNGTKFVEVR